jgi:osmotically-inducible protein OsmY
MKPTPGSMRSLHGPAALAAVALLAACATLPVTTDDTAADRALARRVNDALQHAPYLYARHVDVYARAGVVQLSGYIYEVEDFRKVPQIARAVPGVARVVSNLELLRGGNDGR